LFLFFRRRSEDNNKMEVKEVGREGVDWTDLSQYRDRWWELSFGLHKMRGISLSSSGHVIFSGRTLLDGNI
jgi:hypothetical protein